MFGQGTHVNSTVVYESFDGIYNKIIKILKDLPKPTIKRTTAANTIVQLSRT